MLVTETPRLILRRFDPEDIDLLANLFADPEVMRFSGSGPKTRAWSEALMQRTLATYASEGWGLWKVLIREEGERFIGFCGHHRQEIEGRYDLEIGYRFHAAYWGRGLATEAVIATRDYAFATFDLDRLISLIHPDNAASIRVAEKAGMRFEREIVLHERPARVHVARRPGGAS